MTHRGARPKRYIHPVALPCFGVVIDSLGSEIDQNLSVAQSLHDSLEIELSPQEHISRLIDCKHQHAVQLKAIKELQWKTVDVIEQEHQLLLDVQAWEKLRRISTPLTTKGKKTSGSKSKLRQSDVEENDKIQGQRCQLLCEEGKM